MFTRRRVMLNYSLAGLLAGISGGLVMAILLAITALLPEISGTWIVGSETLLFLLYLIFLFGGSGLVVGSVVGVTVGALLGSLACWRGRRLVSRWSSMAIGLLVALVYPAVFLLGTLSSSLDSPGRNSDLIEAVLSLPPALVAGAAAGLIGWRFLHRRVGPRLEHGPGPAPPENPGAS